MEREDEIRPPVSRQCLVGAGLAFQLPPDPVERRQDSPSTRRRPVRHRSGLGRAEGDAHQIGAGLRVLEIQLIESALQQSQGQVAGRGGAASRLGIPPATLDNKIRVYRIDKSKFLPKP